MRLREVVRPVGAALRAHPRRVAGTVLAVLGGFAAAAFGIAPLAPDAALLPQRVVSFDLPLPSLGAQSQALQAHEVALWRSDLTRSTDTVESLFKRMGVSDPLAADFVRRDPVARQLLQGHGGKMVQVHTEADGALRELVARFPARSEAQQQTHFTRLRLERVDGRWSSRIDIAPLAAQVRLGSGAIRSTLFAATDEAGLPDAIATQLVEIFDGEVDLHRQLKRGDRFSVVYETLTADDQPIAWREGAGRVLAAELMVGKRVHQALWFKEAAGGKGAYFDPTGRSRRHAYLASPLEFSRVTSGFSTRLHPIARSWRAHLGVDYSAPTGTPVRSVADGTVDFAGWRNGYGNTIVVKHGGERSTVYAHLSRVDVRKGMRVEQGQHIGAVGATGWATGPHLHFEFQVDGVHRDPLQLAQEADTVALDPAQRPRFQAVAAVLNARLDIAETLLGHRGDSE